MQDPTVEDAYDPSAIPTSVRYDMPTTEQYGHPRSSSEKSTHYLDFLPSGSNRYSVSNIDASRTKYILVFIFQSIPQQIYLHFLLRLPSIYFSRVTKVFEDAELCIADIEEMAVRRMDEWHLNVKGGGNIPSSALWDQARVQVSPALQQFKSSWEDFVDSLIEEWKVLNVISALLAS